jgi:hypothetical protein
MNVLLLRSEFGGRNEVRSAIPTAMVLGKILTAPDNSFLEIRHHGRKIGTCQLSPSVGELAAGRISTEDLPPEGMVEDLSNYMLDVNGSLTLEEASRLRFSFDLKFSTNHESPRTTSGRSSACTQPLGPLLLIFVPAPRIKRCNSKWMMELPEPNAPTLFRNCNGLKKSFRI